MLTSVMSFNTNKQQSNGVNVKGEFILAYDNDRVNSTEYMLRSSVSSGFISASIMNFTLDDLIVDFIGTKLNFVSVSNIVDSSEVVLSTPLSSVNSTLRQNTFNLQSSNSIGFTNYKQRALSSVFLLPIKLPLNTQNNKFSNSSLINSAAFTYQNGFVKAASTSLNNEISLNHTSVKVNNTNSAVKISSYFQYTGARSGTSNNNISIIDYLMVSNTRNTLANVSIRYDSTLAIINGRNKNIAFSPTSSYSVAYINTKNKITYKALNTLPVIEFNSLKTFINSVGISSSYALNVSSMVNANLFVFELNDDGVGTRITFESNLLANSIVSYISGDISFRYLAAKQRSNSFILRSSSSVTSNLSKTKNIIVSPKTLTSLSLLTNHNSQLDFVNVKISNILNFSPVRINTLVVDAPYIDSFITVNALNNKTNATVVRGESYLDIDINRHKTGIIQPRVINVVDIHSITGRYNSISLASDYKVTLSMRSVHDFDVDIKSYALLDSVNNTTETNEIDISSNVNMSIKSNAAPTQPVKLGSDCYVHFISRANLRTKASFDSLSTEILYELKSTINLESVEFQWVELGYVEPILL